MTQSGTLNDENLVPEEVLSNSPSLVRPFDLRVTLSDLTTFVYCFLKADGIEADIELKHRVFGCELIQEGGILLRLYVHP
jgi:hypothetical protein